MHGYLLHCLLRPKTISLIKSFGRINTSLSNKRHITCMSTEAGYKFPVSNYSILAPSSTDSVL